MALLLMVTSQLPLFLKPLLKPRVDLLSHGFSAYLLGRGGGGGGEEREKEKREREQQKKKKTGIQVNQL